MRGCGKGENEEEEEEAAAVRMFQTAKETGIWVSFPFLSFLVVLDATVMTFMNVLLRSKCVHPETICSCRQFQISFLWRSMSGIR